MPYPMCHSSQNPEGVMLNIILFCECLDRNENRLWFWVESYWEKIKEKYPIVFLERPVYVSTK